MHDTSMLRIVRGPRGGYRLVTNAKPPAILGNVCYFDTVHGSGWRYVPNISRGRGRRRLWSQPEEALSAARIVPEGWARVAIAEANAGE